MDGLFITSDRFNSFSPQTRQEILSAIGLSRGDTVTPKVSVAAPRQTADNTPVELTVAMVRRLTDKLSDKTLNALKIIARGDSADFHMKDVIAGTTGAKDYMDMRGIWSALTRRTRKITDDRSADLIWWRGEEIYDGKDNYVDHIGSVSPMTHHSLRTHFGF